MDFYKVIENRKTVRDFEQAAISKETFERIISAALKAPTNDHMRDWHYIIIQDKRVIAKLLDIIPKGISDKDIHRLSFIVRVVHRGGYDGLQLRRFTTGT